MKNINLFFQKIYNQLVTINGSPHLVALGFGVGFFLGIFPFTGAVAAVSLAVIFKFNKAAALLGSLLSNTWLSVGTFAIAGQMGSMLLGYDWGSILQETKDVIFNFQWQTFFKLTTLKLLLPLFLGYFIIGAICGVIVYWIVFAILKKRA